MLLRGNKVSFWPQGIATTASSNLTLLYGGLFIVPLRKLDANIKDAAHPGWYRTTSVTTLTTHLSTMYGVILGQWMHEVCVLYAQRPRFAPVWHFALENLPIIPLTSPSN